MIRLLTTLALVLLLLPSAASATTVRVDFAGVIDNVEDPGGLLGSDFGLATPFQGHFEFDLTTLLDLGTFILFPPGLFLFPVIPFELSGPSTLSGTVAVGGSTTPLSRFAPLGNGIFIGATFSPEGTSSDIYVIPFAPFPAFATSQAAESCSLTLADTSGTANPGGFYVPTNLEGFESATFGCTLSGGGFVVGPGGLVSGSFSGTITSWVVTPEPSALVLVASAAALAATGRRRHS